MGQLILIKASTESHMVLDVIVFVNAGSLRETVWAALVDSNGEQPWTHLVQYPLIFILLCLSERGSVFNSLWHD